jgi:hypothetical protein
MSWVLAFGEQPVGDLQNLLAGAARNRLHDFFQHTRGSRAD